MNASASLPSSHQVDDGSDGHQHHIAQAKADVAAKVLPPGIANTSTCNSTSTSAKALPNTSMHKVSWKCSRQAAEHVQGFVLAKSP